jgi:hypothetical protein
LTDAQIRGRIALDLEVTKMNKVNPFYVLVDEDGDVKEMFPESISLDWIVQIRDVRSRARQQEYKVYFLNNFELKEVSL